MRVISIRAIASLILALAPLASAAAQEFPSKPVRFIVPYAAGGSGDLLARLLGSRAACEEIKARADELRGTAPAPPFPTSAARAAIAFADALIDELDKREARDR
jgi:hypothetical protein